MSRRATAVFVWAAVALAVAFDLAQYVAGGWEWTISHYVLARCQDNPALAFAAGFVAGHLFWPQPRPRP